MQLPYDYGSASPAIVAQNMVAFTVGGDGGQLVVALDLNSGRQLWVSRIYDFLSPSR